MLGLNLLIHKWCFILLATIFSIISIRKKDRLDMHHYLLIFFYIIPTFLRSSATAAHLRPDGITYPASALIIMLVIGCRSGCMHWLGSHVGSGSNSYDLFGELKINSFISLSEAGRSNCSLSPLNLLSALLNMLHKSPVEVHNKSHFCHCPSDSWSVWRHFVSSPRSATTIE